MVFFSIFCKLRVGKIAIFMQLYQLMFLLDIW